MKKKYFKRIVSLMLALAVFVMFPVAFTQEAQAASTKTFYVVTSATHTYKYDDNDSNTYKYTYTRGKNGFLKKSTYDDGHTVYKRNSKGYTTETKVYEGKKLVETYTYVYSYGSNGLPKTEKCYYKPAGGKKTLNFTSKYTWYSNKHIKKEVYKGTDGRSTSLYWKNGKIKSYSYKGNGEIKSIKETYDSHGSVLTHKSEGSDYSITEKHTLKYDKKGNPVKDVYTVTNKFDNETSTTKVTDTTEYKYDKHGNILKSVKQEQGFIRDEQKR